MGQYFVGSCRYAIIFIFFKRVVIIQSACDIKLILDINIILTATISCIIYLLPLEYTKKFADEKDTKHADQRDSLASQLYTVILK